MKAAAFTFALLLMALPIRARCEATSSQKDAASQKLATKVHGLTKGVQAWHADSEQAGRKTRRTVDSYLDRWRARWEHFAKENRARGLQMQRSYYRIRAALNHQIAEFRVMYRQVQAFFNSK